MHAATVTNNRLTTAHDRRGDQVHLEVLQGGLERLWLYLVSGYVTDTDTCGFTGLTL